MINILFGETHSQSNKIHKFQSNIKSVLENVLIAFLVYLLIYTAAQVMYGSSSMWSLLPSTDKDE